MRRLASSSLVVLLVVLVPTPVLAAVCPGAGVGGGETAAVARLAVAWLAYRGVCVASSSCLAVAWVPPLCLLTGLVMVKAGWGGRGL